MLPMNQIKGFLKEKTVDYTLMGVKQAVVMAEVEFEKRRKK